MSRSMERSAIVPAFAALLLLAAACGDDSSDGNEGDGGAAAGPFGSACSEVPASGAGSFEGMMTEPIVTAASA
ncbi:MAG: fasciclin domain-containing protein, partial [Actinomycetota bacterium]